MNISFNSKNLPPKFLIILPRQLGDVLLGTPIAEVLKQHYPTATIDWWAHPLARGILEGNPFINQIFYYPIWNKKLLGKNIGFLQRFLLWYKFILASVTFLFKLRAQHYDVVIDAMNYPRSTFQACFTGANVRISFITGSFRDRFYTHLIPREELDNGYLGHTKLKLLLPLNISLSPKELQKIRPYMPTTEINKQRVLAWLQSVLPLQKIKSEEEGMDPVVKPRDDKDVPRDDKAVPRDDKAVPRDDKVNFYIMSPAPRSNEISNRCWPKSSYAQLAFDIIQKFNCAVIWTYGPGELPYVTEINNELQLLLKAAALNIDMGIITPALLLGEVSCLAALASGWVGNSNGMSHIAAASGTYTVTLHGPTEPLNWCHPNRSMHRFVQRKVGCIACNSNTCKLIRRECLDDLSVEEVFEQVRELKLIESNKKKRSAQHVLSTTPL